MPESSTAAWEILRAFHHRMSLVRSIGLLLVVAPSSMTWATDPSLLSEMVDAINQIGHVMGLTTIAESVESDDILQKLRNLGVDYVQGYGISEPVPLTQLLHSGST